MDFIETRNLLPPVLLVQRASAAVASCGIGRNPELKVSFYLAGTGNDTPAASRQFGYGSIVRLPGALSARQKYLKEQTESPPCRER
jgi:hypothetical protein